MWPRLCRLWPRWCCSAAITGPDEWRRSKGRPRSVGNLHPGLRWRRPWGSWESPLSGFRPWKEGLLHALDAEQPHDRRRAERTREPLVAPAAAPSVRGDASLYEEDWISDHAVRVRRSDHAGSARRSVEPGEARRSVRSPTPSRGARTAAAIVQEQVRARAAAALVPAVAARSLLAQDDAPAAREVARAEWGGEVADPAQWGGDRRVLDSPMRRSRESPGRGMPRARSESVGQPVQALPGIVVQSSGDRSDDRDSVDP